MTIIDKIDLSNFKNLIHEEIQCIINFTNDENSGQSTSINIANKHQKKKNKKKKDEKCYRCLKSEHFARDYKMKLKDKNDDEKTRNRFFRFPINRFEAGVFELAEHHEGQKKQQRRKHKLPRTEPVLAFGQPEQK